MLLFEGHHFTDRVDAMMLSRFLEWSVDIRARAFPGRLLLGRLYRILLFTLLDTIFESAYRIRICLKEKSLLPLLLSEYRLLKKVRGHFPSPYLCRKWVRGLKPRNFPTGYTDLLSEIHAAKFRTPKAPWRLPETALLAPELDCKGFAVLFSSLLNTVEIKNELWIGIPSNGKDGHAWVVVETTEGRIAVDQFNGNGIQETLFLINHPFSVTFKI